VHVIQLVNYFDEDDLWVLDVDVPVEEDAGRLWRTSLPCAVLTGIIVELRGTLVIQEILESSVWHNLSPIFFDFFFFFHMAILWK